MLAANLIMTCLIGALWFALSLQVAAHMKESRPYWSRLATAAVALLGLLAGLYRMEYAVWVYLNAPYQTFLSTEAALLTNFFTIIDGAILYYYVRQALHLKRRNRGAA